MDYLEVVKNWRNKRIKDITDLEIALDNFRILFAYNSNAIENPQTTYHDTREIFENGRVVNYTGELKTLYEIQNQKICFDFLIGEAIKKTPLSEGLIKKVHKLLMIGCYDEARYAKGEYPGQYKVHEYIIGDGVGAIPEDVAGEIYSLCQEVNDYKGDNPLTAAAYFHLNFEAIHPFADGNGRVGRILMNYYLLIHGYPPIIIYNEDKAIYYFCLAAFDKTERIDSFVEFLKEQSIKTWTKRKRTRKALTPPPDDSYDTFYHPHQPPTTPKVEVDKQ